MLSIVAVTQEHRFFDRTNISAIAITSSLRVADGIATCKNLQSGGREHWLPTQSCVGVSAWLAAGEGTQITLQWILHRRGHHKLERIVPVIGATGSAISVGYSIANR